MKTRTILFLLFVLFWGRSVAQPLCIPTAQDVKQTEGTIEVSSIANVTYNDASLQFVARLDNSDSKTAVNMIQAVFLTHGMKHAAEELDILMDCEPYDDEVYNSFIDELFETEVIAFRAAEVWCLEEPDDVD